MVHPVFRDVNDNIFRDIVVELSGYGEIDYVLSSIANRVNTMFDQNVTKDNIRANVMYSYMCAQIIHDGLVLIECNKEEWTSKISEKTISQLLVSEIKFPFDSGTIVIGEGIYHYAVVDDRHVSMSGSDTLGRYSISLNMDGTVEESIDKFSDTSRDIVYSILSVLMYISMFKKDKRLVEVVKLKADSGSRKKQIPRHSITRVNIRQHILNGDSKAPSEKKYDKCWIVRGHWRNQWYAKEGINRPKWMNPYWKGSGKEQVQKVYTI